MTAKTRKETITLTIRRSKREEEFNKGIMTVR